MIGLIHLQPTAVVEQNGGSYGTVDCTVEYAVCWLGKGGWGIRLVSKAAWAAAVLAVTALEYMPCCTGSTG